jgi:hypothetical protein
MKNIFLIVFFAISTNLHSQNKLDDYKRLIDSTIVIKSIETYNHFQSERNKNTETENWKYYINNYKYYVENIYLLDSNNQPYTIALSKGTDIKFKQIDIYDKKNKKLLKKGIDVWKIITNLEDNKLKINLVVFKVNYADNKYNFSNGGGTTTVFEFSCEKKKWILISNKTNAP